MPTRTPAPRRIATVLLGRGRLTATPRSSASLAAAVTAAFLAGATTPAAADTSARGPAGQTLTVSKVDALSPAGETVTVRGSGYDEQKGIYVAFCVDNGPGVLPTPCGGGADPTGSLGASHWISSNPPSYGEDLAQPYDPGGSFSVRLDITPQIGDVDCTVRACAVVSRADHTRTTDRSQDVRVPVSFAGATDPPVPDTSDDDPPTGGGTSATAAPMPTGTAEPVADQLAVDRVSNSDSAARWWYAATGALVAMLLGWFVAGRLARRRRRRRAAAR